MPNSNITSTEFQASAGRFLDEAGKRPVVITRHKRPYRVLIDIEEYERLKAYDTRRAYRVDELPDDLADEILNAEGPEPTPHLDHLLK